MNQTRCWYRKSLSPSAPTGHRSTTLPDSLLSQRIAGEHVDLFVAAAVDDHQLAGAADLAGEPHAAGAHHAAIDEQRDRVAHLAAAAGERADVGPALVLAVLEVIVLQLALARLVADRAIDRMVDQQVFLDHAPGLCLHLLAVGDERPCRRWPASGRRARAWAAS